MPKSTPPRQSTPPPALGQTHVMPPRVYLAGPDVFLPDAELRAARLREVCARHGLHGVSPLDPLPHDPAPAVEDAPAIAARNEAQIRAADAVIANLTPFRGPGLDAGTAYEIGYARALGRPVFGYTTVSADYLARCRVVFPVVRRDGVWRDADGLLVEDFALADNLMIACGIEASGGGVVAAEIPWAQRWTDLATFERSVRAAAARLLVGTRDGQGSALDPLGPEAPDPGLRRLR